MLIDSIESAVIPPKIIQLNKINKFIKSIVTGLYIGCTYFICGALWTVPLLIGAIFFSIADCDYFAQSLKQLSTISTDVDIDYQNVCATTRGGKVT